MRKKIMMFLGMLVTIFSVSTFVTYAHELTEGEQNESEKIKIEVLFHNLGDGLVDYIMDIVLDDGTRIGDYDFEIIEPKDNNMSRHAIGVHFNLAGWITRDGEISLSLDPVNAVRTNRATARSAWNILSCPNRGFGSHRNWNNTQVMDWQFMCHFYGAPNKDRWNLEPHRTAPNLAYVILRACNP